MDKLLLRSKLIGMIEDIDRLIAIADKQTCATLEIINIRKEINDLVSYLDSTDKSVDIRKIAVAMYQLIGCLYKWFVDRQ